MVQPGMKRTGTLLLLALLVSGPAMAAAQDSTHENPFGRGKKDRFGISAGSYLMTFGSSARVDSDQGSGTSIDLEDDTGLPTDRNELRVDGYWRFSRKHRLDFSTFFFRREATRILDREIMFGDATYEIGGELHTQLDTTWLKLAYRYSFVRNARVDAGFSAGLSTYAESFELEGQGSVSGGPGGQFVTESEDVVAPIPVLGLHAEVLLGANVYFKGSADYFGISISDIKGSLLDLRGDVLWYPFRHFGFGAGYNFVRREFKDTSGTTVDVEIDYEGALVYASYVW